MLLEVYESPRGERVELSQSDGLYLVYHYGKRGGDELCRTHDLREAEAYYHGAMRGI